MEKLTDNLKKVILAGIGAVATTAEKSKDVHSKTEIEIHFCFEDELHSITEKFMEYQAHHGNEVAEE